MGNNRASLNLDLELDVQIDFEMAMPGSNVSDECLREIADRLRISARVPDELSQEPCLADDSNNLLSRDADGCLRVPRDTFCSEVQTIPRPDPVPELAGKVIIPLTANCIDSVQMEDGTVVGLENNGQTEDVSDTDPEAGWDVTLVGAPFCLSDIIMTDGTVYVFPEITGMVTLDDLVTAAQAHADANSYPLTFSRNGSFLHIEEGTGLFIENVIDCEREGFAILDGPTEESQFVEPADIEEFIENLNNEQTQIEFSLDDDGNICAQPNLNGEVIRSVIQCDPDGVVSSRIVDAVPIETEVPGDAEVCFSECASSRGIDYTSVFIIDEQITPADGFDRVVRTSISSDEICYKILGVTTDLEFTLNNFTPASTENVNEF